MYGWAHGCILWKEMKQIKNRIGGRRNRRGRIKERGHNGRSCARADLGLRVDVHALRCHSPLPTVASSYKMKHVTT